jgi:hypothetical protein
MMNDFSKLKATEHMLQWLAEDPYSAICSEFESMFDQQVPGSRLTAFRVTSDPEWLTGTRPRDGHPGKLIVVRTGVAFEFELTFCKPSGSTHKLKGVFSWIGTHLDESENRKERVWVDVDASISTYGSDGELKSRLYSE